MEESFVHSIVKMDGLFARSVSNGKQYLCQSKYISDLNHLLLVSTDCDKLWELELSYNDLLLYVSPDYLFMDIMVSNLFYLHKLQLFGVIK
jgi:hypothetical protein